MTFCLALGLFCVKEMLRICCLSCFVCKSLCVSSVYCVCFMYITVHLFMWIDSSLVCVGRGAGRGQGCMCFVYCNVLVVYYKQPCVFTCLLCVCRCFVSFICWSFAHFTIKQNLQWVCLPKATSSRRKLTSSWWLIVTVLYLDIDDNHRKQFPLLCIFRITYCTVPAGSQWEGTNKQQRTDRNACYQVK